MCWRQKEALEGYLHDMKTNSTICGGIARLMKKSPGLDQVSLSTIYAIQA
jgi:hypothetical protein